MDPAQFTMFILMQIMIWVEWKMILNLKQRVAALEKAGRKND